MARHPRVGIIACGKLSFLPFKSLLKLNSLFESSLLLALLADLTEFIKTLVMEEVVTGLQDLFRDIAFMIFNKVIHFPIKVRRAVIRYNEVKLTYQRDRPNRSRGRPASAQTVA